MSETNETNRTNSTGLYVVIVLLALIAITMGFLWSKQRSALKECSTANESMQADMREYEDMLSGYTTDLSRDLKTDFKNMLKTYDLLKEKDASKADSIEAQKQKIQNLLDEMNHSKRLSASQLAKLRKENETLRRIMKGYVQQIDSLNTLNLQLHSDLDSKTLELNQTSAERDDYKTKADQATEQVKKGSKLNAYNFVSEGLKMKLNNTPKETNRAKGTVMVKAAFTIGENKIAQPGKRNVYLQVIAPNGKILQNHSSGTFSSDNGAIAYSDKKEVDYNNSPIDVAIYYNNDGVDFDKGTYKVRIYADGQLIGSDSFILK